MIVYVSKLQQFNYFESKMKPSQQIIREKQQITVIFAKGGILYVFNNVSKLITIVTYNKLRIIINIYLCATKIQTITKQPRKQTKKPYQPMKTNQNLTTWARLQKMNRLTVAVALVSIAGMGSSCQDTYDLDEKLPPDFKSNTMSYLESNDFHYYSQLVKELGYNDELSGVALKTIFVANDEAFERFFAEKKWGASSYDELTKAQKRMLLYGSMLDNSLQTMNLSSTSGTDGPIEGGAMRRITSLSLFDTVPVIHPEEMPDNNEAWDYYRKNGISIVCLKDATTSPLMFLTENFLSNKQITNEDVDFIFNIKEDATTGHRQPGDANVANTVIEEKNIRTANGFIQRTKDVVMPLSNMAEVIRTTPNAKIFSRLLERFSAPYPTGDAGATRYNNEFGTNIDTLYSKQYLAERSTGGGKLIRWPNNKLAKAYLTFDPGWNEYYSVDMSTGSTNTKMQQDMALMIVPTDEAMEKYWNEGIGKSFKDLYGCWDSVPTNVICELINNGMLNSFTSSVPSKFKYVLNSNSDPMNLTKDAIDRVEICGNGVIYWTNKVFSPTEYVSVSYPALVNPTMNIFNWAIKEKEYKSYLNSLDAYYSFFIPTNDALLSYVDPTKYKGANNEMWEFKWDATTQQAYANVYTYNIETGEKGAAPTRTIKDKATVLNRLVDVLDNHIIVGSKLLEGNVENGHEYYRTKNGGIIRMKQENGNWYVQGTYQIDKEQWLKITRIYDQTDGGNGKTYILGADEDQPAPEPIMTTRKSTMDILAEHEEFSVFYGLMEGSSLLSSANSASAEGNIASFTNFNYTVYVPTNASLEEAIKNGKLHTWDEVELLKKEAAENEDQSKTDLAEIYTKQINDFLKHHMQDNLLMLDLDYSTEASIKVDANGNPIIKDENGNMIDADNFNRKYETAMINPKSMKFYYLDVTSKRGELTIKDESGNERKVLKEKGADGKNLYNLLAREYKVSGNIDASSFVAIHMIDGPLYYPKK